MSFLVGSKCRDLVIESSALPKRLEAISKKLTPMINEVLTEKVEETAKNRFIPSRDSFKWVPETESSDEDDEMRRDEQDIFYFKNRFNQRKTDIENLLILYLCSKEFNPEEINLLGLYNKLKSIKMPTESDSDEDVVKDNRVVRATMAMKNSKYLVKITSDFINQERLLDTNDAVELLNEFTSLLEAREKKAVDLLRRVNTLFCS